MCGASCAEPIEQRSKIVRQRRLELQFTVVTGVPEGKLRRVKRLTGELDRPQRFRAKHVPPFADERMAAQPRLNANLIALARVEPYFDERRVPELLDDAIVTHGVSAFGISGMRASLNQRFRIPHQ